MVLSSTELPSGLTGEGDKLANTTVPVPPVDIFVVGKIWRVSSSQGLLMVFSGCYK